MLEEMVFDDNFTDNVLKEIRIKLFIECHAFSEYTNTMNTLSVLKFCCKFTHKFSGIEWNTLLRIMSHRKFWNTHKILQGKKYSKNSSEGGRKSGWFVANLKYSCKGSVSPEVIEWLLQNTLEGKKTQGLFDLFPLFLSNKL